MRLGFSDYAFRVTMFRVLGFRVYEKYNIPDGMSSHQP